MALEALQARQRAEGAVLKLGVSSGNDPRMNPARPIRAPLR